MDGSQFGGRLEPAPSPISEPGREPLPEREWGLSARQVVVAVLAIVALCQVLGVLYRG